MLPYDSEDCISNGLFFTADRFRFVFTCVPQRMHKSVALLLRPMETLQQLSNIVGEGTPSETISEKRPKD